ncbi:MAG: OsmC family protein [Nocardioidaceae bacterium]|nr:OsmC family protein [Nocardioidaceae bacterium]MCL2612806.1 OsmC family protein [Nocardioidaceae bacterium]
MTEHHYSLAVTWQGDRGTGTSGYRDYGRDVVLRAGDKPDLLASADPTFRGDAGRWNPEELLVAALSQCHLLSYLHSAVRHGIVVTAYDDEPVGTMEQVGQGGRFTSVVLRPRVTVAEESMVEVARSIHGEASENCFIAASVGFPVTHEPPMPRVASGARRA